MSRLLHVGIHLICHARVKIPPPDPFLGDQKAVNPNLLTTVSLSPLFVISDGDLLKRGGLGGGEANSPGEFLQEDHRPHQY